MGLPNEETLCLINEKLETKASSHAGQCILAGSSVGLPRRLLITMSIITMGSISTQSPHGVNPDQ